jgi:SNF2 family DNA or RNA helicase
LTNAQVELYNLFLGSEVVRRATSGKNGMEALKAISMLKKLCNNPLLCLPKEEFAEWRLRTVPSSTGASQPSQQKTGGEQAAAPEQEDGFDEDGGTQLDTQPAVECQDFLARLRAMLPGSAEGAALLSCKLRVLAVLLPQLQKRGHRCLIFSHSTRMLDLIQACVLRVLGLKFLRIDGTIDPKDRDLKLTKFQAPDSRYFCMCLSSQVGGVGLTITGADRVILADPAWNPAMDAQAIDRVHRLGQRRDVVVYRLVGSGAIEDKMFRLQVFKRSLAKTAMEHESQIRFFHEQGAEAVV